MSKVICIGEALIDFMPQDGGFIKCAGGAPANVASAVTALGVESKLITKLGNDFFGDFLLETIKNAKIDTSSIYRTSEANTGLAFVSHGDDGERSFLFYRQPSADMLLNEEEIKPEWFEKGDILHFCSVDLVDAPVRLAHDRAIEYAKKNGCKICFDPNVRLLLWNDHDEYQRVIDRYIDHCDMLKISDEELEFITKISDEDKAIKSLLERVPMVIYTKGSDGSEIHTKEYSITHKGYKVRAVDTTGAGDSFIGAFLSQIIGIDFLTKDKMIDVLKISNATASLVVQKKGAISIMPSISNVEKVIEKYN